MYASERQVYRVHFHSRSCHRELQMERRGLEIGKPFALPSPCEDLEAENVQQALTVLIVESR
jgi:hypothetical protein